MSLVKWSTPTLEFELPADLVFDYVLITIKGASRKYEKKVMAQDVTNGHFSITLTQKETGSFRVGETVRIMGNVMSGETRIPTVEAALVVERNLHDEEI